MNTTVTPQQVEQQVESLRKTYPTYPWDAAEVERCMVIARKAMQENVGNKRDDGSVTWSINISVADIYGKTDEQIQAVIDRKVAINKKSAGKRGLVRKYGRESAERIVSRNR